MEKQKKKQNGITLIALVISIIVMLILAGVSLNMTIGDNGIISQAQSATYLQSCAVLSEYLNQMYVEDVADEKSFEDSTGKTKLEKFLANHSNIFFFNNTYDYVVADGVDEDGNPTFLKLRLIKKVNLDDEIKNQIKGGDANGDSTEAYLSLKDVYGVNDDLQVYYCSDGLSSIVGADFNNSSTLNSSLIMYAKDSGVSKVVADTLGESEAKDITLSEIRSMTTLTISGDSGISNLKFLFDTPNVTRLTFKDYTGSLEGIGALKKLTYIYFDNTGKKTNINYQDLRYATGLKELYFYKPTNSEISKMCTEMANGTYSQLGTLAIFGREIDRQINEIFYSKANLRSYRSDLTTLASLDLLNTTTKEAIKILYLNNNKINTLEGIQNFKKVEKLYLNNNDIQTVTNEIENEDGTTTTQTIYGMSDYITQMDSLTTLYCGFSNIPTDDFNNISNTTITYLSCPGNNLTSLGVITGFTTLKQLQAQYNSSIVLTDAVVNKIVACSTYYLDSNYGTKLSLANIGSEVYLGTDATNDDLEQLRDKTVVTTLEFPSNTKITDDKLQSVLPTLTSLKTLVADSSKLASLDFIGSNSSLQWISVCGTTITDLSNLSNCSNLQALRINTSGLNLKPYSTLISNMCNRGGRSEMHLKCGSYSFGGINAPASLLNTLNGTATDINNNLTVFSCYWGPHSENQLVDLTYTGLTTIKILYDNFTLRVPTTYTTFTATECAGVTIDYTNITGATSYNACQVNSTNDTNFNGYQTVIAMGNVTSIIGTNTTTLAIGTRYTDYQSENKKPYYTRDIASYVTKAPNITNLIMVDQQGFSDISMLTPLKLTNLNMNYCSLTNLNIPNTTPQSNLAANLTTLTITNSNLASLEGLSNLSSIQTLNLSNNRLEDYVTVTDYTTNKQKTIKTTKYIVDSLPNLTRVTLSGNSDIKDFDALTSKGFTETSANSRIFVKQ